MILTTFSLTIFNSTSLKTAKEFLVARRQDQEELKNAAKLAATKASQPK
jgi:curli biogenesis system outer membrane secretion channel CsgG